MKILFIAPQPFFRERGTPIRTLHQLEELSRMGHQVDVLCYPFGQPVDVPGVRVLRTLPVPGIRDVPREVPDGLPAVLVGFLALSAEPV